MNYILKWKKIELLSNVVWFFLKAKLCMVFTSFYVFCFVKLVDVSTLNSPPWLLHIHEGAITGPRTNGDGRNGKLMRGWWMTDNSPGGGKDRIWFLAESWALNIPMQNKTDVTTWYTAVRRGVCTSVCCTMFCMLQAGELDKLLDHKETGSVLTRSLWTLTTDKINLSSVHLYF